MSARLTVLSSMAGESFEAALDKHLEWGLRDVDLKDGVFGKLVQDLSVDEAARAKDLLASRELSVYCLSSILFRHEIESGADTFKNDLAAVDRLIEAARVLEPRMIRLLAPQLRELPAVADSVAHIETVHPWLIPMLGDAVDQIASAGFLATIENEVGRCILRSPREVAGFFEALDRAGRVVFTWDVQNMWQMGTFPSLDVYEQVRPLMGYYHVKGGRHDGPSHELRWRTSLEDASWPVVDITQQVVADGRCPVICLNPPHGEPKPGYDEAGMTGRDIGFLRRTVRGVA